jgi:SAM-dependent methyltransferase
MKVQNSVTHDFCPFCKSGSINLTGKIRYAKPTLFSSTMIELENDAYLMKCNSCESGFIHNSIRDFDLTKLYSESNSGRRWSNTSFSANKSNEIIEALSSFFFKGSIIVDVGCNTGELLDFASLFDTKTIGVELSEESRKIIEQKGHQALTSLDELDDKSIDIITAFDLIEHLHNPNNFIELCTKKLKDGGKLILLTGNINSISAHIAGNAWWYCCYPEHISFISKKYLSAIKDLTLSSAIPTYASKGYKQSYLRVLINFLIRYPLGKYRGLPSLGPDHFLYILSKPERT